MTFIKIIIMAIIQGLTEFLPVSSSGHLAIFSNLFNVDLETGMLYDVMLHLGTLVAVCLVYSRDIKRLFVETIRIIIDIINNAKIFIHNQRTKDARRYKKIVHNNYRKFVVLIIVSTIPTGVIGYAAKDLIVLAGKTLLVPGICLLITGLLLLVTDFVGSGKKIPRDISYTNAFLVGIAQGFGTLPGISRSGITIVACLFGGFDRRFAVKYSFIMSIPAILGAAVLEVGEIAGEAVTIPLFLQYLLGTVIAGFIGYYCIRKMLTVVKKKKFRYFSYYCFAAGVIAIGGYLIK